MISCRTTGKSFIEHFGNCHPASLAPHGLLLVENQMSVTDSTSCCALLCPMCAFTFSGVHNELTAVTVSENN